MPYPGREELLDLCSRLRGEKLLVNSEIELLQQLNQDVDQRLTELLQYSWIFRQQQLTLSKLLNAHPDATPQNCCRQTRTLSERTEFIEAYRKLGGGVNELAVGDLLRFLYEHSRLVAEFLHRYDSLEPQQIYDLSHVIFSAIYGCAIFPSDERRILETLYHLMRLQLLPNATQARRLLRRGNCAFSRLYKWLIIDGGGLHSTKLFLLSALHQPIIDLISSEELFLDIDPGKAVIRFPPAERLRRFGEEGTMAYKENLAKYRREIVGRLVSMAQRFIQSLKMSFYQCFPPPLAWLLRQLYESLTSNGKTTSSEAALIVTDLLFTYFICPSIANPEPLGIVMETPITHIARFNLMQIGQILQTLAVSPWEKMDPKLVDLYGQLDAESVSNLVAALLSTPAQQQAGSNCPPSPQSNAGDDGGGSVALALSSLEEVYDKSDDVNRPGYDGGTRVSLMTIGELNRLIHALNRVSRDALGGGDERQTLLWNELRSVLSRLPESFPDEQHSQAQLNGSPSSGSNSSNVIKKKTSLKLRKPRLPPGLLPNSPSVERLQNLLTGAGDGPDGATGSNRSDPDILTTPAPVQQVLIFSLGNQHDPIGLTPEEAFLTNSSSSVVASASTVSKSDAKGVVSSGDGPETANSSAPNGPAAHEKRTRFSLANQQDLESVGTSDQMDEDDRESVSSSVDAATNPDVMQGLLLLNDNFSDVDVVPLSPNASARGSPNVSGRDTPLSSHTEQPVFAGEADLDAPVSPSGVSGSGDHHNRDQRGDQDNTAESRDQGQHHRHHQHHVAKRSSLMPYLPVTAQKENGADIEEKFGKFEIPPAQHHRERHRDETHSLVSDSWSTDVLASDSEFGSEYLMAVPPGGVCPAGALPDIVPGQLPEFPRLDLIAEEGAAAAAAAGGGAARSGLSSGIRLESLGGAEAEASSAACDRSDTWSVDAVASDSEADTTSVTQRNEDLRDLEMEETRGDGAEGDGPDGAMDVQVTEANLRAEPTLAYGNISNADAMGRGASIPPEITFSMERDFQQVDRGAVRRQSSGSSFFSRQSDPDESAPGAEAKQHVGASSSASKDQGSVDNKKAVDGNENAKQGRGNLSSASSNASSVDTASARAVSGSPTAEERQLAAMRATGAIPKKFRQIQAQLAGTLDRSSPFSGGNSSQHQQPVFGGDSDAGRGFFKGFKGGLTNLKSKVRRSQTTNESGFAPFGAIGTPCRSDSPESRNSGNNLQAQQAGSLLSYSASMDSFNNSLDSSIGGAGETSDEILAKYRTQRSPQLTRPTAEPSVSASVASNSVGTTNGVGSNSGAGNGFAATSVFSEFSSKVSQASSSKQSEEPSATAVESNQEPDEVRPYFDPQNISQCQAFLDAKRKLRQVLSSVDVAVLPGGLDTTAMPKSPKESSNVGQSGHELIQFLRLLLADALTDSRPTQKFLTAQLRETLRCLSLFDHRTIRKLLRVLHEEHRRRTAYLAYLQQSRLTLLQLKAYLEKLTGRISREQTLSSECLVELCSRIFLEQRCEQQLRRFVSEFHRSEAQDEKTDLVEKFLNQLYAAMQRDSIWQWANDDQLLFARLSIERSVMAQIYLAAIYPNGEGDTMRDHIFYETIKRLAAIVTPNHRDLKIPPEYHAECPWPSAQAEIAIINAYKTPRDKVGCVVRCCQTIVSLLRLARPDGRPSADDLVPVLVYIIIKSNPLSLLSTVQYVNGFYGVRLQGEEAYWWTQFCSAVEFIKMMADYSHNQGN